MNGTTWLMWLGVGLAMAAVEAVTVDFVFLMLACGALAGGIASFCGAGFLLSAIVAVVVSLSLLFTLRPALRRRLGGTRDNSDIGTGSIVGRTGHVIEPVDTRTGLVKVAGQMWTARCRTQDRIALGTAVTVLELDGATLFVEPVRAPYPLPRTAH